MNLRQELLNKNKPRHQFHDSESLAWLAYNRPNYLLNQYQFERLLLKTIDREKPWVKCEDCWFTSDLIKDGIHGFRHVCRVAIYSILIALREKPTISREEINVLVYIALLHDCRRKNDNTDPRHGIRAVRWLYKNRYLIPKDLTSFYQAIKFSIEVHNDNYSKIVENKNYKKFKFFVDILKTADALDRYRFPRTDWWICDKFIVLAPDQREMAFAYDFVLESESLFVFNKNNRVSIEQSWKKLNKTHKI
ncbi:MAG: hypothetical protein WDZ85_00320 [Candidatus Paceibacterota bacterium]